MDNILGASGPTVASAKYCIPAWYVVTPASIAANGQQVTSLTTDGDSTFRLCSFQGTSDQDAKTDISPNNFSVQISLQNGRILTSPATSFVPQRIICPTQQFVIPLSWQIDLEPKTVIQFTFKDLSANGGGNLVTFCLVGYKIFGGDM